MDITTNDSIVLFGSNALVGYYGLLDPWIKIHLQWVMAIQRWLIWKI